MCGMPGTVSSRLQRLPQRPHLFLVQRRAVPSLHDHFHCGFRCGSNSALHQEGTGKGGTAAMPVRATDIDGRICRFVDKRECRSVVVHTGSASVENGDAPPGECPPRLPVARKLRREVEHLRSARSFVGHAVHAGFSPRDDRPLRSGMLCVWTGHKGYKCSDTWVTGLAGKATVA